jgi:hypothetical protein
MSGLPAAGRRAVLVGALVAAAGLPLSASAAGPLPGAAGFAGGIVRCGGVEVPIASLPGRRIADSERSGPAEGIAGILRLSEWSRDSPYAKASWSTVSAGPGRALLVATSDGGRTSYVPVYRRADSHWQIGPACVV